MDNNIQQQIHAVVSVNIMQFVSSATSLLLCVIFPYLSIKSVSQTSAVLPQFTTNCKKSYRWKQIRFLHDCDRDLISSSAQTPVIHCLKTFKHDSAVKYQIKWAKLQVARRIQSLRIVTVKIITVIDKTLCNFLGCFEMDADSLLARLYLCVCAFSV